MEMVTPPRYECKDIKIAVEGVLYKLYNFIEKSDDK
jgi:hypothetical protein